MSPMIPAFQTTEERALCAETLGSADTACVLPDRIQVKDKSLQPELSASCHIDSMRIHRISKFDNTTPISQSVLSFC